ncbi:hypothetical protein [Planobispora rosea]|uniref:hypothetical protein n=1 Tax=Planobispora rosea TaxID=35762 RepID=UPI00159F13E9|nr:hypothetical protein [Planobispora rosea]
MEFGRIRAERNRPRFRRIDPDKLPDEMMISAITTAELSVGVLTAAGPQEFAQWTKILQAVEAEFDPPPSDGTAAHEYGRLRMAVITAPAAERDMSGRCSGSGIGRPDQQPSLRSSRNAPNARSPGETIRSGLGFSAVEGWWSLGDPNS